jgi:hypothetical protein
MYPVVLRLGTLYACSAVEFCIISSLRLSNSNIYFKQGPFFPDGTQRYGVMTCLVTVTH